MDVPDKCTKPFGRNKFIKLFFYDTFTLKKHPCHNKLMSIFLMHEHYEIISPNQYLTSLLFRRTFRTNHCKEKLKELVELCFTKQNGQRRDKYFVKGTDEPYFMREQTF